MFGQIAPALRMLAMLTLLTGVAYPFLMTGLAQVAFPHAANGSLIVAGDKILGSDLIGQPFDDPKYFWSRPSATSPQPYNGAASSGSNQGPRNPALADAVKDRVKALRDADPGNTQPVPGDLVTASGSGLDPRHQHGVRLLSVGARRRSTRPHRRAGEDADRATHERPYLWRPGRASRQRDGAQPRARPVTEVAPSVRAPAGMACKGTGLSRAAAGKL